MNSRHEQTRESSPSLSRPLFSHDNPVFDFKFEPIVDADDPGFASEFDADFDDLFVSDDSDPEDHQEDYDSDKKKNDADDQDGLNDNEHNDRSYFDVFDNHMRTLTTQIQNEYLKQPKSTQLILTHESSQLYQFYQSHGSAARLSAAVMSFLEGGDTVCRPAVRKVMEEEVDTMGKKTGRKRTVERSVVERAKLRFVPLPAVGVSDDERDIKTQSAAVGKRKAPDGGLQGQNERIDGPAGGYGCMYGAIGEKVLSIREKGSPLRPRTAGKVFAGDEHNDMDLDALNEAQPRTNFSNILNYPGPQNQDSDRSRAGDYVLGRLHLAQRHQTEPENSQHHRQAHSDRQHIPPHRSLPPPTLEQAPDQARLYSATTDEETQSLLLGRNPQVRFDPLADLSIALPPSTAPTPPGTSAIVTRILALHSHAATQFYTSLVDKYTIPPTPTQPRPPQPPAALFQLAITARLTSDLSHMFTPMMEHPLALTGPARTLFRNVYTDKAPAALNEIETTLLARACGVDEDCVGLWWEERTRERMPWNALRLWVERVETMRVMEAKRLGRY